MRIRKTQCSNNYKNALYLSPVLFVCVCLFVCVFVSLFVCLSMCLLVCLFVCLFVAFYPKPDKIPTDMLKTEYFGLVSCDIVQSGKCLATF